MGKIEKYRKFYINRTEYMVKKLFHGEDRIINGEDRKNVRFLHN